MMARAMATRCCSPPESSDGLCFRLSVDSQELGDGVETVRIESIPVDVLGERDIVVRVECRQQIEALKYEAHFVAA